MMASSPVEPKQEGTMGRLTSFVAIVLVALAACAPAAPSSSPPRGQTELQAPPGAQPVGAKKTIVFGVTGQIKAFSLAEVGSGGAGRALTEMWLQGLVTSGLKTQAPEARIAAEGALRGPGHHARGVGRHDDRHVEAAQRREV